MRDFFEEIFISISKNKLRTFLTGFSIAWGIFMLIVLLASGNGLKNGMLENFSFMSTNSLTLYPGVTSLTYNGMQKSRKINFKNDDTDFIKEISSNSIDKVIPVIRVHNKIISYKTEYIKTGIRGSVPDILSLSSQFICNSKGRNINETDISEKRKVILIHEKTEKSLFRNKKSCIGEYINVDNIPFKIIGVYNDFSGCDNNHTVIIPISTAASIFSPSGIINDISIELAGVDTQKENEELEMLIRNRLGVKHQCDSNDKNALWIWNRLSDYLKTKGIFNGLTLFVWIIGIGTLIAGVVGVSNIMLITVKERTHEFGIRKALGATPFSILALVLTESVLITAVFGYIGMIIGIGLTEIVNYIIEQQSNGATGANDNMSVFKNPTVDLGIIFISNGILIIAGLIAGYIPAKRAVSIKPIDALRGE